MPFNLTLKMNNKDDIDIFADMLSEEGVSISGGFGFIKNEKKIIHILVDDAVTSCRDIKEFGLEIIDCRPVLVLEIQGLPNRLGEVIAVLNGAEIDIDFFYMNEKNQLVLGVREISRSIYEFLDSLVRKKDIVSKN